MNTGFKRLGFFNVMNVMMEAIKDTTRSSKMNLIRAFTVMMFLLLAGLGLATPASANCNPAANQVALFDGSNYSGQCFVYNVGSYNSLVPNNNTAASIKVGMYVRARLARDTNQNGLSEMFTSDDPNLVDNAIGSDQASSLMVDFKPCDPGPEEVAVYDGLNYTGACRVLGLGNFGEGRFGNFSALSNKISSLKVGLKVQVTLFDEVNFGGASQLFTAYTPSLVGSTIGDNRAQSALVQFRPCRQPGPYEVVVYEGENYTGRCAIRSVGEYGNAAAMGITDNSMSSIKVGKHVKARLYKDSQFGGSHTGIQGEDANLSDNGLGNDTVSSMKVACEPGDNEVAFFMGQHFSGLCVVRGIGNYGNAVAMGLSDNSISSVKVGAHVKLRLFREANFAGPQLALINDVTDLGNTPFGDDEVSSAKVEAD